MRKDLSRPGDVLVELGTTRATLEKELIVRALEKFNGNQTHAAQYLDISRKTLIYSMEKFGTQDGT